VTPPEPESDEPPDEEWLAESLLKKLDRDDDPELPLPDQVRLPQLVLACAAAAAPGTDAPGEGGLQLCRGISV
jgi:hypothetical protein